MPYTAVDDVKNLVTHESERLVTHPRFKMEMASKRRADENQAESLYSNRSKGTKLCMDKQVRSRLFRQSF